MSYTDPSGENAVALGRLSNRGGNKIGQGIDHPTKKLTGKTLSVHIANAVYNAVHGEGTRTLDDLETIHDADHPQNDPSIGELSDEDLSDALTNPENGDKVTVKVCTTGNVEVAYCIGKRKRQFF